MNINLPMMINDKLEYNVYSERVFCSDACLYKTKDYLAFHMSGLGGGSNHLDLPLITVQHTFVKKKNNTNRKCNHLTYNYEILPETQYELFEKIKSDPISGLIVIKDQCSCSYETEYYTGDLAFCESLPITEYYLKNFRCKDDWNKSKIVKFIYQSSRILVDLHKRGLIHGDVVTHNFLIDRNGETKLIDLDNLYLCNEEMILQEICAYVLYTVFPILLSYQTTASAEFVISEFLNKLFDENNSKFSWPEVLISSIEKYDGGNYSDFNNFKTITRAYSYNLKVLKENYKNNVSLSNRTQQLQTELLEAIRVKNNYNQELTESHDKQLNEIKIYVNSLETQYKDSSTYAVTLEEQFAEMKKYILSLEENLTSASSYAKNLEENLTSSSSYAKNLEEQNAILNLELSQIRIIEAEQNKNIDELKNVVNEQKTKIDELINKKKRKFLF